MSPTRPVNRQDAKKSKDVAKHKYYPKSTWVSKRPLFSSKATATNRNKNKRGSSSLKSQLRGQQRLLDKLLSTTPKDEQSTEEFLQRKQDLEAKISALGFQNQQNRLKETERKNAIRYHKVKFFERQKLSRMHRKLVRQLEEGDTTVEVDLKQVILDQLYVKHYPNDTKYVSLFPNGVYYKTLVNEDEEVITKRAEIRKRIAEIVSDQPPLLAGGTSGLLPHPKKRDERPKKKLKTDTTKFDSQETKPASGSSVTNDDVVVNEMSDGVEEDDISSSEGSSSSSSVESSSSGASSESSVSKTEKANESESENDDFFVENEPQVNVESLFENAKKYTEGIGSASGDKSKGWATQKQRSGQFKRRIERNRL
mmetsp:Transcript_15776/g.22535  ORF Transcript_15776/g.22535 Transcript_15776/m.22535 type:complete len:368 (-) Transcript_15776:1229-2332(-)|eukprot:CAMPEP_0172415164 /NCGR_PEP_ID=MMETSP1064-20121228/1655_1 /TAXON_ID=202472 /ORGANISM="Aulacoseira subarctica , Strain CCAP 1002/5" /LENGTH=367 /DNA_ID=CAMNT_0013152071 /DNA_START=247 /DNA_END=1350 /DNA_ORIENTATION=-